MSPEESPRRRVSLENYCELLAKDREYVRHYGNEDNEERIQ